MIHTNYQPARKGLTDAKILAAKVLRVRLNGTAAVTESDTMSISEAHRQRLHLRYSDQGDFTRCYRGGF